MTEIAKIKIESIIGKKMGKWTVNRFSGIEKRGHFYMECICECGTIRNVSYHSLIRRAQSNCGCGCGKDYTKLFAGCRTWIQKNGAPAKKPNGVAALNTYINQYKSAAKSKKLEITLSKEDFKKIILLNCHYCGTEPKERCISKRSNYVMICNGIDRKENDKGYILGNCLPCCTECNYLKKDRNYNDFIALIAKINEHLKNEKNI